MEGGAKKVAMCANDQGEEKYCEQEKKRENTLRGLPERLGEAKKYVL